MADFLHPHTASKIVDNSILFLSAQGQTNLFAAMTSERGEDNVATYQSSPTEYLFNYGDPDMAKHGQQGYNIYEWLNRGGGAYVLRVLPDDAVYANAVLEARLLDDTTAGEQVLVKTALTSTNTASTADSLTSYLEEDPIAADADGYDVYRLMSIRPKGRGNWYNNLGFQLEITDSFDSTYDFRVFEMTVVEKLDTGGTVVVEGPFAVSFAPDALSISRESMYIVDVLAKYSQYFVAEVNQDAVDAFATAMDGVLDTAWSAAHNGIYPDINPDQIDWVSGTMTTDTTVDAMWPDTNITKIVVAGATIEAGDTFDVTVDGTSFQSTAQTTVAGVAAELSGLITANASYTAWDDGVDTVYIRATELNGDDAVVTASVTPAGAGDGALTVTDMGGMVKWIAPTDEEATTSVDYTDLAATNYLAEGDDSLVYDSTDVNEIKQLILNAYLGITDSSVTNRKATPIDLLLDGNYDNDIKDKMAKFSSEIRKDCMTFLDTGFTSSPAAALSWRDANQISEFYCAIFTQDFIVYDNFSGRDVKVTSPWYLAGKIPTIDAEYGIHWPFAGPRRGTISGYKQMSWNPTEPEKEQLYKKQVNYFEKDTKRTALATQLTSQTRVTALSNINSVRTLLRIRREVEEMGDDYRMEFGDDTTYKAFQYNLNNYLQRWVDNRACSSIKGQVYASDYDKQQKIARVRIELQFTYVIERVLIDLVVNR